MAKFVQDGNAVNYKNETMETIKYGDVVTSSEGGLIGVAACDISVGATGSVNLKGVYELSCSTEAISWGAQVYWDAVDKKCYGVAGDNRKRIGYCTEDKPTSSTLVKAVLSC